MILPNDAESYQPSDEKRLASELIYNTFNQVSVEPRKSQTPEGVLGIVKNSLSTKDLKTCCFCKQFYICPTAFIFRRAYKEEKQLMEKRFPGLLFVEHLHGIMHNNAVTESTLKVYNCLMDKLQQYTQQSNNTFLSSLLNYEFAKRCEYLKGAEVEIRPSIMHQPIR